MYMLLYPTQRGCKGNYVFDPSVSLPVCQSVSQSISPVILVSATPLKPHNRLS